MNSSKEVTTCARRAERNEDIKKWKHPTARDWRLTWLCTRTTLIARRFRGTSSKSNDFFFFFFVETVKPTLKFILNLEKTQNRQNNSLDEEKHWRTYTSWFSY